MIHSMNVQGRVSVIMPVYNGEKYIGEALDSIVSQTYEDLEIIIVNDGCTDNTITIAEEILRPSGRSYSIYNTNGPSAYTPMTMAFPIYVGLGNSTGEFATIHACDDISVPNRIEILVNIIGIFPLAFSQVQSMDENGDLGGICGWMDINHRMHYYILGANPNPQWLWDGCTLFKKSVYFKRFAYRIGGTVEVGVETRFTLGLYSEGDFVYVAAPLIRSRVHRERIGHEESHVRYEDRGYTQKELEDSDSIYNYSSSLEESRFEALHRYIITRNLGGGE